MLVAVLAQRRVKTTDRYKVTRAAVRRRERFEQYQLCSAVTCTMHQSQDSCNQVLGRSDVPAEGRHNQTDKKLTDKDS
jgi:hypothetical protein